MPPADRHRLRTTFEEVPELYDRARPLYPAALFDDIVTLGRLPDGGRLLEIGCGTGQATVPLAGRGFEIVCVELGERLAAAARAKLEPFERVHVVSAPFETWEPPDDRLFDGVVSFTAFHWVDPDVRYSKPARLLREGGALSVVDTRHVLPEGGDPFFAEVQEDYEAVEPSEDNRPPPRPEDVPDLGDEIAAGGRFENVAVRRHLMNRTYSAEAYIDVLSTYSGNRAMEEPAQAELFERIRRRIDARPGGLVEKTYLFTLNVARRL